MMYPDGVSSYKGSFKAGQFSGHGTLELKVENESAKGKHVYTGGFKEGLMDGHGTFEHGLTHQKFGPSFSNNHYLTTGGSFSKGQTHLEKLDMKRSFHTQKLLLDLLNLPTAASLEEFVHHVNHNR
jgi:hypothetical protein